MSSGGKRTPHNPTSTMTTILTNAEIEAMIARGVYPTLAQLGRMEYTEARKIALEMGIKTEFQKAYPKVCAILITQFDEWVEQTLSAA